MMHPAYGDLGPSWEMRFWCWSQTKAERQEWIGQLCAMFAETGPT